MQPCLQNQPSLTIPIDDYDVKFVEIRDGQEVVTDKVQFKEAFTFGLAFTFDAK